MHGTMRLIGSPTIKMNFLPGIPGPEGDVTPEAEAARDAAEAAAAAAAASEVQTGLDAVATAADRVQTGLDRAATAIDRGQTGLDVIAADASAADAAASATTAANLIGGTVTQAVRWDTAQSLTSPQQAQARSNIAISATNTPSSATGSIAATNVQTAIAELDTEKQPIDATLTALAGVTTAANKLIYATASDTFTTTDLTAFARTLLAGADAPAARATIGSKWATVYDQTVSGSAVSAVDISLATYSLFRLHLVIVPNTAVADFGLRWRVSFDGGSSYDAGASDYNGGSLVQTTTTVSGTALGAISAGVLSSLIDTAAVTYPGFVEATFFKGATNTIPVMTARSHSTTNGTDVTDQLLNTHRFFGAAATNLRILTSTGTAGIGIGSRIIVEGC